MSKFHHILLISTSNTCRSCLAEAILKRELHNKGITDVSVFSRGMVVLFEEPINPKAIAVMENNKVPIEEYNSVQLTQKDVEEADFILTMTLEQKEKVLAEYEDVPVIATIKEVSKEQGEVLDPYGKDAIDYEYCFRELERLVEKLMATILEDDE